MKRKIILRVILICFLSLVIIVGVAEQLQADVASGIVRLHIIANSDEETDQQIKLCVRDAIIEAQGEIFPDGIKKEITEEERERIKGVACNALKEQGASYEAVAQVGNWYFPTKKYGNITLPAGYYDGVRIILGEGKGKNWWCVMYPPLCFAESAVGKMEESDKLILKDSMSDFEYAMITQENIKTVPAFKLVEIWSAVKEKIG